MLRFLLFPLCALAQPAHSQSVEAAHLPGAWRGDGRFYEVKLLRATQPPVFELNIAPDLTLTGKVGDARIAPARPTAVGQRIDYQVVLDGPAGPGKFLEGKDHLIILITAMDRNSFSADFHLKSRFGFDFSMHPGSLEAGRKEGTEHPLCCRSVQELQVAMAPKATVYKVELQINDLDRDHYETHALMLAQHPSETVERVMVRLLTFALFADEALEFGRGLSSDDEPDLVRKSLTGEIEQWIYLGQPDEARIRRACGRAREVIVVGYGGRSFALWWDKNAAALARCSNLAVIEISGEKVVELGALIERNMRLQCLIQDGEAQLMDEQRSVALTPVVRQASTVRG